MQEVVGDHGAEHVQLEVAGRATNVDRHVVAEHLAAGHIDELAKPMYSTCIGLILKGYNDYENKNKQFEESFRRIEVPTGLQQQPVEETLDVIDENRTVKIKQRKTLKGFMDSFKIGLIDLFKEEEDAKL